MITPQHIEQYKKLKTPFYHYNLEILEQTLVLLTTESNRYGYHVHYALKANVNDAVLATIKKYQLGADCVSGNEIKKALKTGFGNGNIVFAGVGKTDNEINFAIDNDIFCFNCESLSEMEVINELAEKKKKLVNIALRINPNINAKTHHYITTGLEENKFGINMWEMAEVIPAIKKLENLKLIGLHFHIGSQITDLEIFRSLCLRINEIQEWFYQRHIIVEHINVGGGLGVDYENPDNNLIPDFKGYFEQFQQFLALRPQQQLHFELGRSIVAQCGNLITKVLYVKKGVNTNFAIVDAGMTDLLRPALYQATHKIENLTTTSTELEYYDVVGPICESSDCFAKALLFPSTKRGDIIAIRTAGAYGEVMASNYNLRNTIESFVF